MSPILHNFYILESDGTGLGYTVYSGPSAKRRVHRRFSSESAAKRFLLSLD
jgi:hypothetical protein